ncbi:MAG TPA: carboxypeptidase-like regulatory domain-containing protein [Vicinamibacterales bacterium]|nr:carboxypeptidase-like regulatory domain-containing protein [Vicinamibacterales bacterium]
MTSVLRAGAFASLFLALAAGGTPQGPPPQTRDRAATPTGTASISGRLTITENGQTVPVRRARVTLESSVLPRPPRVDTDTDGRFQFTNLPAGTYRVIAEKAGFVPRVSDPRRAFERPAPIDLNDGQAVQLDIPMQRGAAIDGAVVTDTGDPAINIVVTAERYSYDASGRHLTPVRQARTDDRGHFRVHTLPPGEYFVEAGPDPLDLLNGPPTPGQPPPVLAHTFYPGTPRVGEARTISLAVGQNVSDMDVRLTRVAVVSVKGHANLSSGAPAKDVYFRFQRVGGPVGEVRGWSLPESSEFDFPAVPPGDYWVMAVARPSPGAALEYAAVRLTVVGQNISDLVVTTAKGASIAGRVDVDGGAAPLPADLRVVAYETDYSLPALPGPPAPTTDGRVDPSGTFAFSSLFGPRLLRLDGLPATWAIKSIALDDRDISETATDFQPGGSPRAVHIVITPRTAVVRGAAQDDGGRPVGHARVVLFSTDERQWQPRSRTVRAVETGPDGQFAIEGVLAGDYAIVAVPYLEEESWTDATVLRGLRALATTVALTDGASTTVTLKVR